MSTPYNAGAPGTQKGTSSKGALLAGIPIEFIRYLISAAADLRGNLTPTAAIQIGLRSTPERHRILESLCHEICPPSVNPLTWARWLAGGPPPLNQRPTKPPLKKPTNPSERPANLVIRTTERVSDQEQAVVAAKAKLAQEEEHLALLKAHDSAALHFLVVDQLVSIVEPLFAMGPAWTIMRSLSGHLPQEVAEKETGFLVGGDKDDAQAGMRASRVKDTEAMMNTLDFFSGHIAFEEALRSAVAKVCNDFDKQRDELVKDGRRPRSKERMQGEVHPKAQDEADEVLDGLRKAS